MYENYTGTPTRRDPDENDETTATPDVLNEHLEDPGDPDGVVAADEERRWQAAHAQPDMVPITTRKRTHHIRNFFITIIVIAAAAVGAFWFGNYKASTPAPKTAPKTTAPAPKSATAVTKHYDSVTYTLGIDYPQNWSLSDTAAKLTVTSPSTQLTTTSGSKSGHIIVTVQNQQTAIAGFPASGAVEVLESDKLTYKQPTAIQRAQTYLSYLSYNTATGLDALYVTGDNGYMAQQYVPLSDIIKANPLISVSFEICTTTDCATGTPTPVTLLASSWKSAAFSSQVTNILESLQLD